MLTAERLREVLRYDPETGIFVWLDRPDARPAWRARYPGTQAGTISGGGYRYVGIDGRGYLAHRLAWLYVTGEWPKNQIDHVNCTRSDNRFSNLREATNAENTRNSGIRASNTSGFKGVAWDERNKKFIVHIGVDGKLLYLGRFHDPAVGAQVYRAAAEKYHGEFARVGV